MSKSAFEPATGSRLHRLQEILRGMESVLVTFSGGADSTFLAKVAAGTLGDAAVAMTAVSASLPAKELEEAQTLARLIGIRHLLAESRELDDPRYAANPVNRCYFCKSELFALARRKADELGLRWVADGTQADDLRDVRPGRQAAREWQVRSPLLEAGFTKEQIREASRVFRLPTWDKPAAACLASRIPTGTPVTLGLLSQVERCEDRLKALGIRRLRARHQGEAVRLELEPAVIARLGEPRFRGQVAAACRQAGFRRVLVDLTGCRAR